jgi:Delta24(24(1))-sterol reductase
LRSDDSDAADSSTGLEDEGKPLLRSTRKSTRKSGRFVKEDSPVIEVDGFANGLTNGLTIEGEKELKKARIVDGWEEGKDPKVDYSGHFEFGGSYGVSALMICFPLLMYYMWIGATYYDGKPPTPSSDETFGEFLRHLVHLAYTGAFPSLKAWAMYWTFFIFEGACYCLMPGTWTYGKPLAHENGKTLPYYCSALWSWWTTIAVAIGLHVTGLFKLYTIIDEFGPIMSVAILSGFLVAIVAYVSAIYRGKQHRMTGHLMYDFFMGAELNPRMFGILDFKMFFEVRLPWYILFLTTLGTAARQYERYGFVSGEVCLLLLAHFLYANACSKSEELIVPTWDMYYEKWGFMLIFWNLAGVPLSYCHCTVWLANHHPDQYPLNKYVLAAWFVAYMFVYWVWDTCNSQKNRFRAKEHGGLGTRKAFPVLPWQDIENPRIIYAENGGTILADGWCKYSVPFKLNCADLCRRTGSQGALHLRSLLCSYLGRRDRLQLTVSLVLSPLFLLHDHPPSYARHSTLSRQVWQSLGAVRARGALPLYSRKSIESRGDTC